MNVFDVQGHLILGHKNILKEGFAGVKNRAIEGLIRAKKKKDLEGINFLEAVIICCDAVSEFAKRFAAEAELLAALTDNSEKKRDLLEIAGRCPDRVNKADITVFVCLENRLAILPELIF